MNDKIVFYVAKADGIQTIRKLQSKQASQTAVQPSKKGKVRQAARGHKWAPCIQGSSQQEQLTVTSSQGNGQLGDSTGRDTDEGMASGVRAHTVQVGDQH